MSLISLVIVLAIVGFLAWLVLQIPMAANMQRIIVAVICFFMVIWVLQQFGLVSGNLKLR